MRKSYRPIWHLWKVVCHTVRNLSAGTMVSIFSRLASVLVAIGYVIAALVTAKEGQQYAAIILAIALLLPLALIWFPDVVGDYIGPTSRGGYIDRPTPALMIAIAGWFFLVGLPLIAYQLGRSSR